MASADFSASSFRRYRRPWPFRADGEISRNKTHFFRPAGCGFTTLLRLGLGLRLVLQTCPQVGLVSAFCAYPPNFASDFLHPRPRGRKLVLGYLVPPNWPIGDFHSRPCVMSCVIGQGRNASPPTPRSVPVAGTSRFPQFSAVRSACSRVLFSSHPLWHLAPISRHSTSPPFVAKFPRSPALLFLPVVCAIQVLERTADSALRHLAATTMASADFSTPITRHC